MRNTFSWLFGVLLPGLAGWDGIGIHPLMAERLALFSAAEVKLKDYATCGREHAMSYVLCWLITGERDEARQAVEYLMSDKIASPTTVNNGGVTWEWALAFDLLALFPRNDRYRAAYDCRQPARKSRVQLLLLGNESVSLWHGRSTLAAQAWLMAIALHGGPGYKLHC